MLVFGGNFSFLPKSEGKNCLLKLEHEFIYCLKKTSKMLRFYFFPLLKQDFLLFVQIYWVYEKFCCLYKMHSDHARVFRVSVTHLQYIFVNYRHLALLSNIEFISSILLYVHTLSPTFLPYPSTPTHPSQPVLFIFSFSTAI